jgi:hypothetical protein
MQQTELPVRSLLVAIAIGGPHSAVTTNAAQASSHCTSGYTCIHEDMNYGGARFRSSTGYHTNLSLELGWNDDTSSVSDSTVSTGWAYAAYFENKQCGGTRIFRVVRGGHATVTGSSDSRNDKVSSFTLQTSSGTNGSC